jgi:hypothetical protein
VLENVGSAVGRSYMNDVVEFVETSKTDFIKYTKNLFKRLIQNFQKVYYYRPERPTKKAFSGSAGVHESLLKSLIEAYIVLVEETVNEAIIPACVRLGLLPVGCYFQSDNEQKLSLEEMVKIVSELLKCKTYRMTSYLNFGVPVETKLLKK